MGDDQPAPARPHPADGGGAKMSKSWRDVLPVHPAANLFPMLPPEDLRKLGEDIKANGLQTPVVLWAETEDSSSKLYLLNGRNRLDAMEAAGLETYEYKGGVTRPSVPFRCLY